MLDSSKRSEDLGVLQMKPLLHVKHGSRCSCRILAEAVGCEPEAIAFSFCQVVLKKRWIVECNHDCTDKAAAQKLSSKWHESAPIDPVKAILIMNEEE